ncbi:Succinate dehydrogenase flavoprotein subunit [subsurface metagenome]
MAEIKPVETEVLVIGGGIAGIRAAIESHDRGTEVTLVNKGALAQDGAATWMAGLGHEVALYPPDSVEVHAEDCIVAGKYLGNQELIYTLLKLGSQNLNELWKWGVRFPRDDKGRFLRYHLPGHTYARSMSHRHHNVPGKGFRGPELRQALAHQIRRRKIKVMEDLFITDLLTRDNTVVGAVGIDLSDGEFKVVKAKSTILATGGYMCCYRYLTAGNASTGDGHAIAYRAGAKLMDMEFIQFLITGLWPPSVQGGSTPFDYILLFSGWLLNNKAERFMERYSPEGKEWTRREVLFNAIASEFAWHLGSCF